MEPARVTKRASRNEARDPVGGDRRLHQRRQVVAAQPADRRRACWSRTRCSRPSTRPCGGPRRSTGGVYTLADTVGFVRHLPHQLVEAFRSTLEEVADADLMLHVVDASHPDPEGQIAAVRHVFADIPGAMDVPEIIVLNKADLATPEAIARLRSREVHSIVVSARTRRGHRRAAGADRRPAAAPRRRASTWSCRTTAATWSAACTSTATSRPRSTPPTARPSARGSTPASPPSSRPRRCPSRRSVSAAGRH